jgi:hypothetical protein
MYLCMYLPFRTHWTFYTCISIFVISSRLRSDYCPGGNDLGSPQHEPPEVLYTYALLTSEVNIETGRPSQV